MIEFSDGTGLECSGPLRVEEIDGQWYVLGDGVLLSAEDEDDAKGTLQCIRSQGIYMNMKVLKSAGARARIRAALDCPAVGLESQGVEHERR